VLKLRDAVFDLDDLRKGVLGVASDIFLRVLFAMLVLPTVGYIQPGDTYLVSLNLPSNRLTYFS